MGIKPYDIFGATPEERIHKFNMSLQYLLRHLSPEITLPKDFLLGAGIDHIERSVIAFTPEYNLIGYGRIYEVERFGRVFSYLEDLVVLPEFRSQGIGSDIVKRLIGIAKANEHYKVVLTASQANVAFYESLGFRRSENGMRLDLARD